MRCIGGVTLCLMLVCAGCSSKPDPAVLSAAEHVLKLGGTFILHGATIPVKDASKIPPGPLPVRLVNLNGLKVRDEQIEPLKSLSKLEELHLEGSYLTDKGLAHLQELKKLQILDLHKSIYITDKGLDSLKALPSLQKLELSYTRIGDGGADTLAAMKQVKTLHLTGTRVTAAGLKKLKEGLPNCEVLK